MLQSSSFFRGPARPRLRKLSEEIARGNGGILVDGDDFMRTGNLSVDMDFCEMCAKASCERFASLSPPLKIELNGRPPFRPKRLCRIESRLGLGEGCWGGLTGPSDGDGGSDGLGSMKFGGPSSGVDSSVFWLRSLELVRLEGDDEEDDSDGTRCAIAAGWAEPFGRGSPFGCT